MHFPLFHAELPLANPNTNSRNNCCSLLGKDPDPKKFENLTDWDFPLELTEWNLNPYPNGLQDLSPEIKKQLREGARAKIVYDAKVRSPFWWKSSQDLMTLQWKTTDDPTAPYNNSVPISRLRTLKKGTTTPLLKAAAAKDRKRKLNKKRLFLYSAPAFSSPFS